jgi:hypothetical protein
LTTLVFFLGGKKTIINNFLYDGRKDESALYVNSKFRRKSGKYEGFSHYLVMLGLSVLKEYSSMNGELPVRLKLRHSEHMSKFYDELNFEVQKQIYWFSEYKMPPNGIKEVELKKL